MILFQRLSLIRFFNFDNSSQYGFHYAKDIDQPWVEGVGGIDGFETALITPTDFNQDGKLDMVVAQTVVTHGSGWTSTHIQLLKNDGNRKFSDVTSSLINNQNNFYNTAGNMTTRPMYSQDFDH